MIFFPFSFWVFRFLQRACGRSDSAFKSRESGQDKTAGSTHCTAQPVSIGIQYSIEMDLSTYLLLTSPRQPYASTYPSGRSLWNFLGISTSPPAMFPNSTPFHLISSHSLSDRPYPISSHLTPRKPPCHNGSCTPYHHTSLPIRCSDRLTSSNG